MSCNGVRARTRIVREFWATDQRPDGPTGLRQECTRIDHPTDRRQWQPAEHGSKTRDGNAPILRARTALTGAASVALIALLVAPGCGSRYDDIKSECEGPHCTGAGDTTPTTLDCTIDSDCGEGYVCVLHQCTPGSGNDPDRCSRNDDCAAGMYCHLATGACVSCLNDDHCPAGMGCLRNGVCGEGAGNTCQDDDDCPGLHCLASTGACVQCVSDAHCSAGQVCRQHSCFGQAVPSDCTSHADCAPYGKICDSASGQCRGCASDAECGDSRVCRGEVCVEDPGSSTPGTCATADDCSGQQACFFGNCMPCIADFMCQSFEDLFSGNAKICDTDTGQCIPPECSTAQDCPAGEGCYTGHCGACMDDSECRVGEVCDPSSGVCGQPTAPECSANGDCSDGRICEAGRCRACTSSTQCGPGLQCDAGACVAAGTPTGPGGGNGDVGTRCSEGGEECNAGLFCLTGSATPYCTRPCIGSGRGANADCPLRYGCYNFESGTLDGLMLCIAASDFPADYPAQGFDQAPGAWCSPDDNRCQTGMCLADDTCARTCMANRDCGVDEVCWAAWGADGVQAYGVHVCANSDTTSYIAAGDGCNAGADCDSGICVGRCDDGSACNSSNDCILGACLGVCRDHCRSTDDCAQEQTCGPWPMQLRDISGIVTVCTPQTGTATGAMGAACADDTQCSSAWCLAERCTTPCATGDDCVGALADTHCLPATFVDANNNPTFALAFCQ